MSWEAVSAFTAIIQTGIAGFVAWVGWKTFLAMDSTGPADDRIVIFQTRRQSTELRATPDGLECHVLDVRPGRGGYQWTLKKADANPIVATPAKNSGKNPKSGRLQIGPRRGWLYTPGLFESGTDLENQVKALVDQL